MSCPARRFHGIGSSDGGQFAFGEVQGFLGRKRYTSKISHATIATKTSPSTKLFSSMSTRVCVFGGRLRFRLPHRLIPTERKKRIGKATRYPFSMRQSPWIIRLH